MTATATATGWRAGPRILFAVALSAALCGCDDPARIGDRFVDLYFVETDQARARRLTTGLAKAKLDEELRLVESVRRDHDAEAQKPSIAYTRRTLRVDGQHARASYDVTIREGADRLEKQVLLSLDHEGDRWKVANFLIAEGHAPAGQGAPPPR